MGDIFWALKHFNEGEVMWLLDADPTLLEREDDRGDRPLAVAAHNRRLGVVRLLVERGANINARGRGGRGVTALRYAAELGHEEVVALLLSKGAQANTREDDGKTPLMLASEHGYLGVVKMLVQHMRGQGLDDGDDNGWTALHSAAGADREEVVRFLLLAGADPTITNNEGRTPRALAEQIPFRFFLSSFYFGGRQRYARCVAVFQVSFADVLTTSYE
jgi:ankyrin repeat protein